jgi:glycosyltransferase involved in cell wall biosynthesis
MKRLSEQGEENATSSESKYATVLIPTSLNNARTLPYSLRSVQMQGFSDMEILVVGDGAPPATRDLVHSFAKSDSRIRYFEFPKGERRGEAHRAMVLAQASGRIICYCADDDLWLPFHLESMVKFLRTVDFGHSWAAEVDEFGRIHASGGDIGDPICRKIMCTTLHVNIGLTALGHTADAYHRLPGGWHPAPPNILTDLYMCRRFFAIEGLRFGTLLEPSTIRFGPFKWMQQFRDLETPVEGTPVSGGDIADWINRIEKPGFRAAFEKAFFESVARRVGFGIHADRERLMLVEEHQMLVEEHHRVLASNSWRFTAPVRSLKSWISSAARLMKC